jgi:hypothetical protein
MLSRRLREEDYIALACIARRYTHVRLYLRGPGKDMAGRYRSCRWPARRRARTVHRLLSVLRSRDQEVTRGARVCRSHPSRRPYHYRVRRLDSRRRCMRVVLCRLWLKGRASHCLYGRRGGDRGLYPLAAHHRLGPRRTRDVDLALVDPRCQTSNSRLDRQAR